MSNNEEELKQFVQDNLNNMNKENHKLLNPFGFNNTKEVFIHNNLMKRLKKDLSLCLNKNMK
jgi:hypothetical protein